MGQKEEIQKRRTFAIISHPDAGKTTLTEKFLLYGGAIQTAGAVKSNKIKKTATSDFMEIERQRGISVSTSVMSFEYQSKRINLLDTPGHKDFAEDTYRTLSAVDSVILVIDCVKGVETQTENLMRVCRMRKTPVIIFINKMDLEGRDSFDLLDELEEKLSIKVRPLSWPIGIGRSFQGVYDLYNSKLRLFDSSKTKVEHDSVEINNLTDSTLEENIGEEAATLLVEETELINGVYDPFKTEVYQQGELAPVFFGSALNNFGVKELLESFIELAPAPQARISDRGEVDPFETKMTGFIFKIHANLDPNHRDRLAYLRICSGKFERNKGYHHVRLDKQLRFSSPATFMAQDKQIVNEAWPGDVVGLYDTGNFKIGDSLTEGKDIRFTGIPSFSPEIFRELVNKDPMKSKQLEKGIHQLTDEGVAQLFTQKIGSKKIIGAVGALQFDVIQYRLEHEYKAKCDLAHIQCYKACWITSDDDQQLSEFVRIKSTQVVRDKDDNLVFMAPSAYILDLEKSNFPKITFHLNSEFKTLQQIDQS